MPPARTTGTVPARMGVAETAVAAVALAAAAVSIAADPGPRGALGAGLALLMLAIAVTDARRFVIPDGLTAAALVLALADAALADPGAIGVAIGGAVLRGAVPALAFFLLRAGYRWLRSREGLGLGDVKLAFVAGAWLDWTMLPVAIEIAALAALLAYLLRSRMRGRRLRAAGRLPFGLFLAPAIWLSWLAQTLLPAPW